MEGQQLCIVETRYDLHSVRQLERADQKVQDYILLQLESRSNGSQQPLRLTVEAMTGLGRLRERGVERETVDQSTQSKAPQRHGRCHEGWLQ